MTDIDEDDDLAAELDDDDNDPAGDDAGADPHAPTRLYGGICDGGPEPYPGKLIVSRCPAGVLIIDKGAQRVWVLDFDSAGGIYRVRDEAGSILDHAGRWRAAEGAGYEVRAYDPEFGGDDPRGDAPDTAGGDEGGQVEGA